MMRKILFFLGLTLMSYTGFSQTTPSVRYDDPSNPLPIYACKSGQTVYIDIFGYHCKRFQIETNTPWITIGEGSSVNGATRYPITTSQNESDNYRQGTVLVKYYENCNGNFEKTFTVIISHNIETPSLITLNDQEPYKYFTISNFCDRTTRVLHVPPFMRVDGEMVEVDNLDFTISTMGLLHYFDAAPDTLLFSDSEGEIYKVPITLHVNIIDDGSLFLFEKNYLEFDNSGGTQSVPFFGNNYALFEIESKPWITVSPLSGIAPKENGELSISVAPNIDGITRYDTIVLVGRNSVDNSVIQRYPIIVKQGIPSPIVINQDNSLLQAPYFSNAAYQWYFSSTTPTSRISEEGFELIIGATERTYSATQTGYYKVAITHNGNTRESDPIFVNLSTTGVLSLNSNSILVYPNPASDFIRINSVNVDIEVFNGFGNKVLEKSDISESIDITGLSNGIYFVKIRHGSEISNQKIIIRR